MNSKCFILTLTLAFLLSACGSWSYLRTGDALQQKLNTWHGYNYSLLYEKFGEPTEKQTLPDGRTILTYRKDFKPPASAHVDNYYCIVRYTIDKDDTIMRAFVVDRVEPPWGIQMPCDKIVSTVY